MSVLVVIDRARCIGAGVCVVAAPASFQLDGSSRASLRVGSGHDVEAARLAAESCPLGAIRLIEEPDSQASTGAVAFAGL